MEDLNELPEKVQKLKETADIIKQYKEILRTKRKGIVSGILSGQNFQMLQREGKVYTDGKQTKDP